MNAITQDTVADRQEQIIRSNSQPDDDPQSPHQMQKDWRRVTEICERAALGDLEARITHIDPNSDFGRLCQAINHMLDIADSFVRESSAAMENCGNDRFHRPIILRGLKGAYRESAAVINQAGLKMQESNVRLAATERLTKTAQLAAETAANLTTMAAACEELNSSNAEISRQAADSAQQTEAAVNQACQASTAVQSFSDATRKVEGMLSLVSKIAGQTNLLALNATIEAARAGEQGRSFAVVANEVKELARSSAKAAQDIGQQIDTMRNRAAEVAQFIKDVNSTIQHVNHGASNIAQAVKEQLQVTDDIGRNVAQASCATNEISTNMKGVLDAKG